jgi:diguanylate cyclase (GGDEF)-like protein
MDARSPWWRDRVLGALALTGLVIGLWYGVPLGPAHLRTLLFWPTQPPLDLFFLVCCHRVATAPGATYPERRFWATLRNASCFFLVGDTYQSSAALLGHPEGWIPSVDLRALLVGVGSLLLIFAMLAFPVRWSGRDRLRLWLDLASVIAGCATFMWYFWLGQSSLSASELGTRLLTAALTLVSAFALCKLALGGDAPFTRLTGLSGAVSGILFAVSAALPPALLDTWKPHLVQLMWLTPNVVMAVTPRLHERAVRRRLPVDEPETDDQEPRRGQSLLPYLALGATQGLLIVAVVGAAEVGRAVVGVLAGVTLIIALIVGRQILVLRDNVALVKQLDVSLQELGGFQDRLWHEARHDQLTQLANRTLLHERIQSALQASGAQPEQAALLLLDLDRFKAVNDTLGHHVGDALLVHVADQLRAHVRGTDTVARLGGDEFVVLMPGAGPRDAQALAHRLQTAFVGGVTIEGHRLDVGASIGIATGHLQDAETLLRQADADMYRAKQIAHAAS